jgi:putative flippase GtrA
LRYAVTGLVTNALLFLSYVLLKSFGLGPKTAMTVLYGPGVLVSFAMNRQWTFRHSGTIPASIARYVAVYALGYVVNLVALLVLVDALGLPDGIVVLALIFATAVIIFLLQKFWVFPSGRRVVRAG